MEEKRKKLEMTYYAIRVSPQKERATRALLRRRGQTCYLPAVVSRRVRKAKGRRRIAILFPGYLFIRCPDAAALLPLWLYEIKETRNVLGFVSVTNDGLPSAIAESKIERLKKTISDDLSESARRKDGAKLKKGREVKLKSGPLIGNTGKITWMRGDRVKIFGWLFGTPREIEVSAKDLEAA